MDRRQRLIELFDAGSDLRPEERSAFLKLKCAGDATLLKEVKSLLDCAERAEADQFMNGAALEFEAQQVAQAYETEERVGQLYGQYKLLSLLGAGGMGEVYLAEDTELQRKVALKLVTGGLKTKEALRRFHNEQLILANLEHPNIARLLSAGATPDGLPFIVMEYVEGERIDRYADEHRLSVTARLKLFRTVCSAVTYAHQHLVIHRDIKPSNILVTADGTPKLLDFGIAKLFDPGQAAELLDATATLLRVMTPEYASPEQVRGESITTASDVYSLGVLLYELLTGRRPYYFKSRKPEDVARAVCDEAAERPSAALSRPVEPSATGGASPEEVARGKDARGRSADAERRRLRGDLDNIILMALRKEPQRRYASVGEFSEDIRRHLEGLPVRARRDTFAYRASKFVRRNGIAVTAAAMILLTLVGGIIATAWQAHVAGVERVRAENRFNQVRELAHSVLFNYHDAIATLPGSTPVREQLVRDALKYLDNLADDESNSPSLQRELANAYLKVGDIQGKPYNPNLGDTEGALASYRKAQTILESLLAAEPNNSDVKYDLALACQDIGRIYQRMGNRDESLKNEGRAVALGESLVATDAANVEYQRLLSSSHLFFGQGLYQHESIDDYHAALDSFRKALVISEGLSAPNPADIQDRYFAAICNGHIGYALWAIGDTTGDVGSYREAMDSHRKYKETMEAVSASEPTNAEYKRVLVYATSDFGTSQLKTGDAAGALLSYQKALAMFEKLMADDPADIETRRFLASLDVNISEALAKTDNITEALAYSRKALAIYETLQNLDPTSAENQRFLVITYDRIGDLLDKMKRWSDAQDNRLKALAVLERLPTADRKKEQVSRQIAVEDMSIAREYEGVATEARTPATKRRESWRQAREWYQHSLREWQEMQTRGTLSSADAGKPDEVSRKIAKCDAALGK